MRNDNLTGILLMTLSMALFAIEDSFIKLAATSLPVWEILLFMGIGGIAVFSALLILRRERFFPPEAFSKPILYRMTGEIIGRVFYSLALALASMSVVATVLQATPLAVTLGAALVFKETVGPRRWAAVIIGFFGVLLIIRPGLDGFEPAALLSIVGLVGLSVRDLATRAAPRSLSNYQLGLYGFVALIPTAMVMQLFSSPWVTPDLATWLYLLGISSFGVGAYYLVTAAMRVGEVSAVTPFRYTRILFALTVSVVVFSESIDSLTLVGSGIVIASGLYTIWRENRLRR
jgi:drug/metabolite transporter (DMT)-like permease